MKLTLLFIRNYVKYLMLLSNNQKFILTNHSFTSTGWSEKQYTFGWCTYALENVTEIILHERRNIKKPD